MTKLEVLNRFYQFIDDVICCDKTPSYDYGRNKSNANARGELPEAGERWKTPREMAWERKPSIDNEIKIAEKEAVENMQKENIKGASDIVLLLRLLKILNERYSFTGKQTYLILTLAEAFAFTTEEFFRLDKILKDAKI